MNPKSWTNKRQIHSKQAIRVIKMWWWVWTNFQVEDDDGSSQAQASQTGVPTFQWLRYTTGVSKHIYSIQNKPYHANKFYVARMNIYHWTELVKGCKIQVWLPRRLPDWSCSANTSLSEATTTTGLMFKYIPLSSSYHDTGSLSGTISISHSSVVCSRIRIKSG